MYIIKNYFTLSIPISGIKNSKLNHVIEELEKGVTLWKIRNKWIFGFKAFERKYQLNLTDLKITYYARVSRTRKRIVPKWRLKEPS